MDNVQKTVKELEERLQTVRDQPLDSAERRKLLTMIYDVALLYWAKATVRAQPKGTGALSQSIERARLELEFLDKWQGGTSMQNTPVYTMEFMEPPGKAGDDAPKA